MPITFQILDDGQTLLTRVTRSVTEAHWIEYRRMLADMPELKAGFSELIDLTQLVDTDFTPESLKRISAFKRGYAKYANSRRAIVVPDDELFKLARHSEKQDEANRESTTVFNHLHTAITWLNLSAEAREQVMDGKPLFHVFEN